MRKMSKSTFLEKVGQRLFEVRKRLGMKRAELARKIGLEVPVLERYEKGTAAMNIYRLYELALDLGVTFSELFPVEDEAFLSKEERNLIMTLRDREIAPEKILEILK